MGVHNPNPLTEPKKDIEIVQKDSSKIAFEKYLQYKNEIIVNNVLFTISHYTSIINSKEYYSTSVIIDDINNLLHRLENNYVASNYPIKLSNKEIEIVSSYFLSFINNNARLDPKEFKFFLTQLSAETIEKIQHYDFSNS